MMLVYCLLLTKAYSFLYCKEFSLYEFPCERRFDLIVIFLQMKEINYFLWWMSAEYYTRSLEKCADTQKLSTRVLKKCQERYSKSVNQVDFFSPFLIDMRVDASWVNWNDGNNFYAKWHYKVLELFPEPIPFQACFHEFISFLTPKL